MRENCILILLVLILYLLWSNLQRLSSLEERWYRPLMSSHDQQPPSALLSLSSLSSSHQLETKNHPHLMQQQQHTDSPFVLITEPRCWAATPFVVRNALTKLPSTFPVVFWHSHHNEACVQRWIQQDSELQQAHSNGRLIIRKDHRMNPNIAWTKYQPTSWNSLLYVNDTWWEDLRQYGNTVLTMQSDTLICSPNHSMVPWHTVNWLGGISHSRNTLPPSDSPNVYHLNGGFSLRQMDWVITCIRSNTRKDAMVEDALFNSCALGFTKMLQPTATAMTTRAEQRQQQQRQPPSIADAMMFSSDGGHTLCVDWLQRRRCPYGVHKPWTAGKEFPTAYQELLHYCPDIVKLEQLQRDESNVLVSRASNHS